MSISADELFSRIFVDTIRRRTVRAGLTGRVIRWKLQCDEVIYERADVSKGVAKSAGGRGDFELPDDVGCRRRGAIHTRCCGSADDAGRGGNCQTGTSESQRHHYCGLHQVFRAELWSERRPNFISAAAGSFRSHHHGHAKPGRSSGVLGDHDGPPAIHAGASGSFAGLRPGGAILR